jgi:hypothetical protein
MSFKKPRTVGHGHEYILPNASPFFRKEKNSEGWIVID